ncbi:FAD-binding domain-containing protein, partial [Bacillus vallismortis]|uniref:FAD-binding domain-containing protein n=1 Tax=Bacillus vallismortis TaxID=72361 RepID=UPI00209197F3
CISFDIHSCFLDEKWSETNLNLPLADGSGQLLSGRMLFRTSGYLILSPNRRGSGGLFIKRYIPELKPIRNEFLYEPWKMVPLIQARRGLSNVAH